MTGGTAGSNTDSASPETRRDAYSRQEIERLIALSIQALTLDEPVEGGRFDPDEATINAPVYESDPWPQLEVMRLPRERMRRRDASERPERAAGLALLASLYRARHVDRIHETLTMTTIGRLDVRVRVDVNLDLLPQTSRLMLASVAESLHSPQIANLRARDSTGQESKKADEGLAAWLPVYLVPRKMSQPTIVTTGRGREATRLSTETVRSLIGSAVQFLALQELAQYRRLAAPQLRAPLVRGDDPSGASNLQHRIDAFQSIVQMVSAREARDSEQNLRRLAWLLLGQAVRDLVSLGPSAFGDSDPAPRLLQAIEGLNLQDELLHAIWLGSSHSFITVLLDESTRQETFTFDLPSFSPLIPPRPGDDARTRWSTPRSPLGRWIRDQRSSVIIKYQTQAPMLADSVHVSFSVAEDMHIFPFIMRVHRAGTADLARRRLEARQRKIAELRSYATRSREQEQLIAVNEYRAERDSEFLKKREARLRAVDARVNSDLEVQNRVVKNFSDANSGGAFNPGLRSAIRAIVAGSNFHEIGRGEHTGVHDGEDDDLEVDNDPRPEVAHAHWATQPQDWADQHAARPFEAAVIARVFPQYGSRYAGRVLNALLSLWIAMAVGALFAWVSGRSVGTLLGQADAVVTLLLLAPGAVLALIVADNTVGMGSELARFPKAIAAAVLAVVVSLAAAAPALEPKGKIFGMDAESVFVTSFLCALLFVSIASILLRTLSRRSPHDSWRVVIGRHLPAWINIVDESQMGRGRSTWEYVLRLLRIPVREEYFGYEGVTEVAALPQARARGKAGDSSDTPQFSDRMSAQAAVAAGRFISERLLRQADTIRSAQQRAWIARIFQTSAEPAVVIRQASLNERGDHHRSDGMIIVGFGSATMSFSLCWPAPPKSEEDKTDRTDMGGRCDNASFSGVSVIRPESPRPGRIYSDWAQDEDCPVPSTLHTRSELEGGDQLQTFDGRSFLHFRLVLVVDEGGQGLTSHDLRELTKAVRRLQAEMLSLGVPISYLYFPGDAGPGRVGVRFATAIPRIDVDVRLEVEAVVVRAALSLSEATNRACFPQVRESDHGSAFEAMHPDDVTIHRLASNKPGFPSDNAASARPLAGEVAVVVVGAGAPKARFASAVWDALTEALGPWEMRCDWSDYCVGVISAVSVASVRLLMPQEVLDALGGTESLAATLNEQRPDQSPGESNAFSPISYQVAQAASDPYQDPSRSHELWLCWDAPTRQRATFSLFRHLGDLMLKDTKLSGRSDDPATLFGPRRVLPLKDFAADSLTIQYLVSRLSNDGDRMIGRCRLMYESDTVLTSEDRETIRRRLLAAWLADDVGKETVSDEEILRFARIRSTLRQRHLRGPQVLVADEEPADGAWLRLLCTRA